MPPPHAPSPGRHAHGTHRPAAVPGPRPGRFARQTPLPSIRLIAPAAGTRFAIDGNAAMPVIVARAEIVGLPTRTAASLPLTWTVRLRFTASVCPHGPARNINHPDITRTGVGHTFRIPFALVRGGSLTITVAAVIDGRHVEAHSSRLDVRGTNPTSTALNAALPHDALRKIARQESGGGRQFAAAAGGGVGKCPLWSGDNLGGVGIMQITVPRPTDDQVWSWRENVAEGVRIFNQKVAAARGYPAQVRRSRAFHSLVSQFNLARRKQGLAAIPVDLPDFTTGDFNGNLQQLELDSIRGFNGFGGRDHFGLHLHEFRVALDAHGQLRANVDAAGTRGTAIWERVPVAARPQTFGDPNYVNHVLAQTI